MSTEYEPVIGLEIHVQLKTRTKMFCGCELSFGEEPNTRTCPVCLGLPGHAAGDQRPGRDYGIMMGLALGCEIAPRSIFHRKNYFYPDLSKGYQISQYDIPLCLGGQLGDVRIHRIHLEEDAAKLVHVGESGRIHGSDASIVDYNRGGTPLAEIVTEPDIHSAEQARDWLQLLRETLRQLGVSDVNMEEGSLRCDANVSIRPVGTTDLGTKTELKNMNSFRFVMQGINAEIARQTALARGRRAGRAGDAALRPGQRPHQLAALQGGGARLPLLPGARPRPDRPDAGDDGDRRARRSPSCRPSAKPATRRDFGLPRTPRTCSRSSPSWGDVLRARGRGRATGRQGDRDLGHASCARVGADADPASPGRPGRARASSSALVGAKQVTAGRRPHDPRQAGRRRRRPGRDRRARGPDGDGGHRRARASWPRSSPRTRTSSSASRAATPRRWARSSARSCARPRAAPTAASQPPAARAARRLAGSNVTKPPACGGFVRFAAPAFHRGGARCPCASC